MHIYMYMYLYIYSSYEDYMTCLNKWKTKCPKGVDLILQENYKLRIYLLKMKYICETANDGKTHTCAYQRLAATTSVAYSRHQFLNNA